MCGRIEDDPSQHSQEVRPQGLLRAGSLLNGRMVLEVRVDRLDERHVLAITQPTNLQNALELPLRAAIHPFVVWDLDREDNAFNGGYFYNIETALDELKRRGRRGYKRPASYRRRVDETCAFCQAHGGDLSAPPHDPSPKCESGGHSHCTCDICF